MKTIKTTIAAMAVCLLCANASMADLELTLTGTNGSNVVSYSATGSVVLTGGAATITSGIGRAVVGGTWNSAYDADLGDFLSNSMNTSLNDDLVLSGGGISYRRNGFEFGVLDTLDLDGSSAAGGDDVELDNTVNILYPTVAMGETISWTGSGTFTLEGGETFDTLFTSLGSFSNAIDGGLFTVNIQLNVVPEPGSAALFCTSLGFLVGRRRKKLASKTV